MGVPSRTISRPLFGQPYLACANAGRVGWVRAEGEAEALLQKGSSGYLANLYGGVQDGDDWAALCMPVNELRIPDFKSAQWTYRLTNAEVYGVNMVIWAHDPKAMSKRCEITQAPSGSTLAKADGWNGHVLNTAATQFFFYGETTTGTDLTAGTQYTWAQFQADVLFSTWTIYRITFEYGWYSTGTFEDAWVADVQLNGQVILLEPRPWDKIGRETKQVYLATAGTSTTKATIITPAATKKVKIKNIYLTTLSATAANFEVYFHTGDNITSDATKAIAIHNLDTDTTTSVSIPFGDNGPEGEVAEVVSIRTSVNITTNGIFVVVYNEV